MPPGRGRPPKEPDLGTFAGRVGARLRELRTRAGWSVDELKAELAERGLVVETDTLYKWERGTRTPRLTDLPAFAEAYRMTPRGVLPPK